MGVVICISIAMAKTCSKQPGADHRSIIDNRSVVSPFELNAKPQKKNVSTGGFISVLLIQSLCKRARSFDLVH
jgi:hypothetical protein